MNFKEIEKIAQDIWKDQAVFKFADGSQKQKYYVLDMFPYPSGDGLHVGHIKGYFATDIVSNYMRLKGMNVLHPMGWDAFGLPAENYAIKVKKNPREIVKTNVANFKQQMQKLGLSYDWDREINTTDPEYYKWTQWIFLQMFKKGLAYQDEIAINFCPSCKTGLANEEVVSGACERCHTKVSKKKIRQWILKITEYADRLLEDLKGLDWPEPIIEMQKNWIGRSEGSNVVFGIEDNSEKSNFLFLHAYQDNSKSVFWPWLAKELTRRGANKITALDLPNTTMPNIAEQVKFIKENFTFDENSVVVTHSLGAVAAMKLLGEGNLRINKLILVAPPLSGKEFIDKKPRPILEKCCDWDFNFEIIKKNTKEIIVLADENDHILPVSQVSKLAKMLGATFLLKQGQDTHFNNAQEPEVLKTIATNIEVFTTRIDTLYGCTYLVLSPEYKEINKIIESATNRDEIAEYIRSAEEKSDIERTDISKEKTGVKIKGVFAINPANDSKVEIWIADYVLAGYGTGAVMAVPAHDERDYEFATKYNIEIKEVIAPKSGSGTNAELPYVDYGLLVNSDEFNEMNSQEAMKKITEKLKDKGDAEFAVNYKLRDWIFSRQRYWGEPIPIVHCERCGTVPVDEKDLPVALPEVESYEPTGTGESPLAAIDEWVNTKCPKCGGPAKRETNTMPQWAGSCWYYLRYIGPNNSDNIVDSKKESNVMPVDLYVGGAEHAVLHLLYARFWHKFLYDIKVVSTIEPFQKLMNVGLILAPDRQKMSKSRGNVISPDDMADSYGVDSLRMYEMFMGPFEKSAIWNKNGITGTYNFLKNVLSSFEESMTKNETKSLSFQINALIKSTGKKIESMSFNTIVSDFMKFANSVDLSEMSREDWRLFTICLSPIAPHTSEYMWNKLGEKSSVFKAKWPDVALDQKSISVIIIQVNGKKRGVLEMPFGSNEEKVTEEAINQIPDLDDKSKIIKTIFVKDKIINFVTK